MKKQRSAVSIELTHRATCNEYKIIYLNKYVHMVNYCTNTTAIFSHREKNENRIEKVLFSSLVTLLDILYTVDLLTTIDCNLSI